ncbi:uncharacterized protein EI97DRAFT_430778 [Westerdykella ornata]|uniref:Protein Zds1 C-terminal domain-containing protein n=1 Tax=Westerdykella ornata TaxID=318751 RepID=A0A6A6JXG1_WESOR|nr:uncharacterized protein EI97DRAFT_430778 [Westerdykella ornata]KAF2279759.1 hypothetical protein EI97DRAFT_430778 [Westerdykella ornata]
MQASERAAELERVYQSRRGHASQLSISDDTHHVTEAIGDMYGDDQYSSKRSSRPLSFISNPLGDTLNLNTPFDPFPNAPPKSPLRAHMSNEQPSSPPNTNDQPSVPSKRTSFGHGSANGLLSPPSLSRSNSSDTATQQFPLNDIDYESSPASLAKELSNLQAIRRMSMDVNTADPDLPSFGSFSLPTVAPPHFSEDEDPSKLFWVPARLHPELAPKEFKTFIEEKVDKIRRRSGDADSLSPDSALGRSGSGGGLRRKKSMLSRQIDNANGYRDGAERLERKRSGANQPPRIGGLEKLQELAEDPASLMRRLSIDSVQKNSGPDGEVPISEDLPILPVRPAGPGSLKRSTRTNYRRGSLRKGERVPFSKRVASRQVETDNEESPSTSPTQATYPREPEIPGLGLHRVNSEPVHGRSDMTMNLSTENFSRPTRRSPPPQQRPGSADDVSSPQPTDSAGMDRRPSHPAKPFHSRIASNGRTTAPLPGYVPPPQVPQIIETPPPQESPYKSQMHLPERNSSRVPPQAVGYPPAQRTPPKPHPPQPVQPPSQRQSPSRPPLNRIDRNASPIKPAQSFDDLISHPSPLPGNSTRTDALSIIPNLVEEKKTDKKSKDKKDGESGSRKTSWGWLLGSDDGSKKEKEEREKELARKVKNKLSKQQEKTAEKAHDDTRLDVLHTSIQSGRGRESLVLDRDSIKLEEERKKESTRKSSGDSKKEKESGLFSSIFGGSKKKGEKESSHKKGSSMRGLSPDPPPRVLRPDIDYNWTRFSILEERAIYRMAHIKLANPRRELYSQVLLSNFMYSYLAKVQQMHPQIQIGNSKQARHQREAQQAAQQKREQEQQQQQLQQQQQQQPEEYVQYQLYQQDQSQQDLSPINDHQVDNHGFEQHDEGNQYRPDSRGSQHDQQRDSHHSSYGKANGSYSVSYNLGYPSGNQKQQQSYYAYDDSDQSSRDEEMW